MQIQAHVGAVHLQKYTVLLLPQSGSKRRWEWGKDRWQKPILSAESSARVLILPYLQMQLFALSVKAEGPGLISPPCEDMLLLLCPGKRRDEISNAPTTLYIHTVAAVI